MSDTRLPKHTLKIRLCRPKVIDKGLCFLPQSVKSVQDDSGAFVTGHKQRVMRLFVAVVGEGCVGVNMREMADTALISQSSSLPCSLPLHTTPHRCKDGVMDVILRRCLDNYWTWCVTLNTQITFKWIAQPIVYISIFCHHLLTLMSFQTCMTIFFLWLHCFSPYIESQWGLVLIWIPLTFIVWAKSVKKFWQCFHFGTLSEKLPPLLWKPCLLPQVIVFIALFSRSSLDLKRGWRRAKLL